MGSNTSSEENVFQSLPSSCRSNRLSLNNTSSQGNDSQILSTPRRFSRLSLNKTKLDASQNKEPDCEVSSQTDNKSREKHFRDTSSLIPASELSKNNTVIGNILDFNFQTASNTTNPVSALTGKNTVMSNTITIETSESEPDANTSTDDCFIDFTQPSYFENEHNRSNWINDDCVNKTSSEKSKLKDFRSTCENSQTTILDDKCNSTIFYDLHTETKKDSHMHNVVPQTQLGNFVKMCKAEHKRRETVPFAKEKINHNTNSYTEKRQSDYFNSDKVLNNATQEITSAKNERSKISRLKGLFDSFINMQDEDCSGNSADLKANDVKRSFSHEEKHCVENKLLSNTQDNYNNLANSILKSSVSQGSKKLIMSSVNSLSKKKYPIETKEQSIVISDEESDTETDIEPMPICRKRASDSNIYASALKRRKSAASFLRRQSTLENNTETLHNFKSKQKVAGSISSHDSSHDCSLSQEIPYQGEGFNQSLDKIHDNPGNYIPKLSAKLSHASTCSMPSLQQKPSSFYENKQFEDLSPPQLSQHISHRSTSSEEFSKLNMTPLLKHVQTIAAADKMSSFIANKHDADIEMFTENYSSNTEQSENNLQGNIVNILNMPDTTNESIKNEDLEGNRQGRYSDVSHAKKELDSSIHQHDYRAPKVSHVNDGVVNSVEGGSEITSINNDIGDTKTGATMYSEIYDEICVLDSCDEEFFMSQSVLGNVSVSDRTTSQNLNCLNDATSKLDTVNSNFENSFTCKQIKKIDKSSVSGQFSSKMVEGYGNTEVGSDQIGSDTDNFDSCESFSDSDDLYKKAVPLSQLVSKETSSCKDQSQENIGSKNRDFSANCGSEDCDDDSYFLSQIDNFDDLYYAQTQVDYVASSDEELAQVNKVMNSDGSVEVNNVIEEDITHKIVSNVKKTVNFIPEDSKDFDNNAAPSTSYEECDTQDPFSAATQVYPVPIIEEDHINSIPVSVSGSQRQFDIDDNSNVHLSKRKNSFNQESLARSLSLESLFNSKDLDSKIEDFSETEAFSPLPKEDKCGSIDSTTLNATERTTEKKETDDSFEIETLVTSCNDLENSENIVKPRNVTDKEGPYNLDTLAYNSSSEDSDFFFSMATQKSFTPKKKYEDQLKNETMSVPVSINEDTLSPPVTGTEDNFQLKFIDKDPFHWVTLEASQKMDIESPYNLSTQKINLQTIKKQNIHDKETSSTSSEDSDIIFTAATQRKSKNQSMLLNDYGQHSPSTFLNYNFETSTDEDPFETSTLATSPNKNKKTSLKMRTQKCMSEKVKDVLNTNTFTASYVSNEDKKSTISLQHSGRSKTQPANKVCNKTTLSDSMSTSEDTQDPADTMNSSQTLPKDDTDNLYNAVTQKICVPEKEYNHSKIYNRNTLAVPHFPLQESIEVQTSFEIKHCNKELINEDTQDPLFTDNTFPTLQSHNQDHKETSSLHPFTKGLDSDFYIETQKNISHVVNQSQCKNKLASCLSILEDGDPKDSSEDSQSCFYIKTQVNCPAVILPQNPYDLQTVTMSSSFTENTVDPYSVETQVDSLSDDINSEQKIQASSLGNNRDTLNINCVPSVFENIVKENYYQSLTQIDLPDIKRHCNQETKLLSVNAANCSTKGHINCNSEDEDECKYFLHTQVDSSQHARNSLTSSPIKVTQTSNNISVHKYFESALNENNPYNIETLVDSPDKDEQGNVSMPDLCSHNDLKSHHSNQNEKSLNTSKLVCSVLKSIRNSRPSLTKCLTKYSVEENALKMSLSDTKNKSDLNLITQKWQLSPYFMKITDDPSVVRDPPITDSNSLPTTKVEPSSGQAQIYPTEVDNMNPRVNVLSSKQSYENITSNENTPDNHSHGYEGCEHTSSLSPKDLFLGVAQLTDEQYNSLLTSNNEQHLFLDQENVLQTKTSLKSPGLEDIYANKLVKGSGLNSHKINISCGIFERLQDSSSALIQHTAPASRQCTTSKAEVNHKYKNDSKETNRKRCNKDTKHETNIKRVKVTSTIENPTASSWITVDKCKNVDKIDNKCKSLIIQNKKNTTSTATQSLSKPRKKRVTLLEKHQAALTGQVEQAKLILQNRLKRNISVRKSPDKKKKILPSKKYDDNEDVQMPSTQDMMSLGLPILGAKLPVSKKHLALGLPSQGRLASEEKDPKGKYIQPLSEKNYDDNNSVKDNRNDNKRETLPPVPIFIPNTDDHLTLSHSVDINLPNLACLNSEKTSTSVALFTESKNPVVNQPVKNTCSQISDSKQTNKIAQSETVTFSKSQKSFASENILSTIPTSTQSEVVIKTTILEKLTPTLQQEKKIAGQNLQQLHVCREENGQKLQINSRSNIQTIPGLTENKLDSLPAHFHTGVKTISGTKCSLVYSNKDPVHMRLNLPQTKVLKLTENEKLETKIRFQKIVLNWNPAWLSERETVQSLPQLFGSKEKIEDVCTRLRLFYSKCEEYVNITLNLLVLECWESIYKEWKMSKPSSSHSLTVHCVQTPKHPTKLHEIHSLVSVDVVGVIPQTNRIKTFIGDFVILDFWGARKLNGKFEEPHLCQQFGIVRSVVVKQHQSGKRFLETYKIFESTSVPKAGNLQVVNIGLWLRNKGILITPGKLHKIKIISSLKTMERQLDALINLQNNSLCTPLLLPRDKDVFFHQTVQPNSYLCTKLNKQQASTVATILQDINKPEQQKVYFLQGPPGTGKSHTILALIHQILLKTNFKARICLATPSNAAVDEIARRIISFSQQMEKNRLQKISLVRVGNKNKVQQYVKKFMWDELVEQRFIQSAPESLRFELKSLERQEQEHQNLLSDLSLLSEEQKVMISKRHGEIQAQILKLKEDIEPRKGNNRLMYKTKCEVLDMAHIICGTLNSLGSEELKDIILRNENHYHKNCPFTCLIIDEATQAIEVDCLIPLQYKMSKVILVGDHEQLPATVLSQIASDKCLARSMFERLTVCIKENFQQSSPIMMLTRQYRMHSEILSFPNKLFYDNQLVSDESVQVRKEVIAPYLVFDVEMCRETRYQNNRSISNVDEAQCTAQLCEIVKHKINNIGVICPYADQQIAILRCLKQRNLNVEVNTVDSFQGQERDVIVLSCVRAQSNPSGIGFLADRKRMNVALTRAKHALYVIGHFDTLRTDDYWEQLYNDASKRKLLVKVTTAADFVKCAEDAVLKITQSTALVSQ